MTEELYTIADATQLTSLAERAPAAAPAVRAVLVVYRDDDGTARVIELADATTVTFGRSRSATVHINSDRVSRNHARIARQGERILVEDLQSRNGTWVNGHKITAETQLRAGDEITVGPVTAVLSVTSPAARTVRIGATALLAERLDAEVFRGRAYGRPFALIMIRLEVNEAGEDAGQSRYSAASNAIAEGVHALDALDPIDAALAAIAKDLTPMDTLAEYGPDELAVLVPEADRETGLAKARRLAELARTAGGQVAKARAVRQSSAAGMPGALMVRAGLAVFPDHGSEAGALVAEARAALRQARLHKSDEVATPASEPSGPSAAASSDTIVADPQMQRVYEMVRKVAAAPMTVLICGETGAGKEVIAEALHRESPRQEGPFVRVNCACIAETLLESELFGHERGAFTGADKRRVGYFEAADRGTLFLDEIGEITPALQAKLLRVLEKRTIMRVGGIQEIPVDVRVVCATNRDLHVEVDAGRFRSDLYFRISAFVIMLPPLRDRPSEIPLLAEHFVRQSARDFGAPVPALSPAALALIQAYHWPGNVRELRNAMERAVVLQSDGMIAPEHLPERVRQRGVEPMLGHSPLMSMSTSTSTSTGAPGAVSEPDRPTDWVSDVREHIADVERSSVMAALETSGGNQTIAARKLGISRRALIYRMEKYGLKPMPASRR